MKTHMQTLKENPKQYISILILLLVIGVSGWLARFTLVIGFAKRIEDYPIMILYILFSFIFLWLAGLNGSPSRTAFFTGLAVSLVYTGLCFAVNVYYGDNVPLCALTAMSEILLFCLAEYGLRKGTGKTFNGLRLLLKGLVVLILALAVIRLIYIEQIRLLPVYRIGTAARAALRSEIMTGVSTAVSIIFVLWFFALFITEKMADNSTLSRLRALIVLVGPVIVVMLISKQVISGFDSISFSDGSHSYRIDSDDPLWCSPQEFVYIESKAGSTEKVPLARTMCRVSGSFEESQRHEVLYAFPTAAGPSPVDSLAEKKYVTTFADEVILVNGNRGWEFLVPAATAGMAEYSDLLNAIRDGIENGRLLLAVNCLDYLRRYDPGFTDDLLKRWSQGSFTEGESCREQWFNLAYFTEWAANNIR